MSKDANKIGMALPCKCPHCHMDIVVNMDLPAPEVTSVVKAEDLDENIKKLINEKKDDTAPKTKT